MFSYHVPVHQTSVVAILRLAMCRKLLMLQKSHDWNICLINSQNRLKYNTKHKVQLYSYKAMPPHFSSWLGTSDYNFCACVTSHSVPKHLYSMPTTPFSSWLYCGQIITYALGGSRLGDTFQSFPTCLWHNVMLSQTFPEIIHSVLKYIDVTVRKKTLKSKGLWLWVEVVLDSYTIVFPTSDSAWLPSASFKAAKACYFSTCTTKNSIQITKKNNWKNSQVIYPRKMLVRLDADYPYCLSVWSWKALQAVCWKICWLHWYLFSKQLLKSYSIPKCLLK